MILSKFDTVLKAQYEHSGMENTSPFYIEIREDKWNFTKLVIQEKFNETKKVPLSLFS